MTDGEVDALLAAGDHEAAARAAAALADPTAYRKAMERCFEASKRGPSVPTFPHRRSAMQFDLDHVKATVHYTPRRELHGEDREPAASLVFDLSLGADLLAMFSPTLRWSLYFNPNKATNGGASPVDDANDLRYPELDGDIKWKGEIVGGEITIHHGLGGKSDIRLPATKTDDFRIAPQNGGLFALHFRVACRPDERQCGALAMMQDGECEISFASPEAEDLVDDEKPKRRRKAAAEATA